jgi:hypothetical protein
MLGSSSNAPHYQSVAGRRHGIFTLLDRERPFSRQFLFSIWRRRSVYSAAKPLTIQKERFQYVFSCSQFSGRACVNCDDCAGRYDNQEARIA